MSLSSCVGDGSGWPLGPVTGSRDYDSPSRAQALQSRAWQCLQLGAIAATCLGCAMRTAAPSEALQVTIHSSAERSPGPAGGLKKIVAFACEKKMGSY